MKPNLFRIFIAEDNAQYLALLEMQLASTNAQLQCFDNIDSLLQAMDQPPHLLVLDYFFGDQAMGLDLVKEFKIRFPEMKVLIISGQDRVEVAIEALKAGAIDYLEKDGNEFEALQAQVAHCMAMQKSKAGHSMTSLKRWVPQRKTFQKLASLFSLLLVLLLVSAGWAQAQLAELPEELTTPYPNLIVPDDKVSVSIWDNDNLSVGSIFGIYNSNEVYGKWVLVNQFGEVNLPLLGTVSLSGVTTTEAAELLKGRYGEDVRDPVVVVKVLNREVTVIGEVKEPGNVILDKEQITLAEVIGQAQGFSDYAKLKKVTLTRKTPEGTEVFELDLRKTNAQDMNHIYVRRGDCINVPERFGKKLERKLPLLIPFASLMTGVGVLYSVTNKNP